MYVDSHHKYVALTVHPITQVLHESVEEHRYDLDPQQASKSEIGKIR